MLKRKIMGLLLAAAMLVTMLPASALTAQAEEAEEPALTVQTEAEDPALTVQTEEAEEPVLTAETEEPVAEAEEEPVFTEQATTISTVTLTGVTAPVTGQPARTTTIGVTAASHCTISTASWFDLVNSRTLEENEGFRTGNAYELRVTVVPDDGYAFAARTDMQFVLNDVSDSVIYGKMISVAGGGSQPNRSVRVSFYATDNSRIDAVWLNGYDVPSEGAHPQSAGYSFAPKTTLAGNGFMRWRCVETDEILDTDDTFQYGLTYRYEITFYPKDGYDFAAVQNIDVYWNGKPSGDGFTARMWVDGNYTNSYGHAALRVDYTFPRVGKPFTTIPTAVLDYVEVPYVGDVCGDSLYAAAGDGIRFTVTSAHWRDFSPEQGGRMMNNSETFRPGGVYSLELILTPDKHYWFADDFNVITNHLSGDRYTYTTHSFDTDPSRPDMRIVYLRFVTPSAFTDVTDEDAFYYRPVYWAAAEGITTGWDDGTFRPWNTCNRAAIITFLWRLAGSPMQYANNRSPFEDVDGSNQFYPAIMWGYYTGIIGGFEKPDGTLEFRPWNNCNRAAIVTFLYRYAKYKNGGNDVITDEVYAFYANKFSDMTGNAEFDRAIAWAVWGGITTGWDDGTFRPWNTCNRAAAMSFLYRYATMPAG